MDLLPTFASLAKAELPDATLDGVDATDFLMGSTPESPRDEYHYYSGCLLTGVRSGAFKLVLPRPNAPPGLGWWGRMIEAVEKPLLYNLDEDPGETTDVSDQHPQVVADLMIQIESARKELGDIDQTGAGARFFDEGKRKLQMPLSKDKGKDAGKDKGPHAAKSRYDGFKPVGSLRFTFESRMLDGWKASSGDSEHALSDRTSLPNFKDKPFNHEGGYHLSTLTTRIGFADKSQAVYQSPTFVIEGDRASFLASGGFDRESLYVGLVDAATDEVLRKAGGPKGPQMKRTVWNVSNLKGKTVYLQVVDKNTDRWGHLTFDDFSIEGTSN